jgi:mono/diheme cytochrome c family protein
MRILLLLICLFLYSIPVSSGELPGDYALQKNPLNPGDKAVIDRGRTLYTMNCSKCHGEKGDGKGPLAEGLSIPPFTKETLSNKTDGYLLWIIENGKGLMPDFGPGSILNLSRDDIWRIITYIRLEFGK